MRYLLPDFPERRYCGELILEDWEPPNQLIIPDDAPRGPMFLYGFACEGFYKVGQTNNVDMRFRTIQANLPFDLRKVAFIQVPPLGANYGESYALRQMGEPVRGEWFSADGKDDSEVRRILGRAKTRAYAYRKQYLAFWEEFSARDPYDWQTAENV